ncbi:MAG TPA: hypothetical protein ENJ12_09790 [Thiolapillus brandeum]|uniref:Glycosyltransferase RgtA/B/C/D-like domain-containing protein n=1 Tax=Thiolapillus brandeum TaxID=1076588 RepID=A0A831RWM3_9GAMM|nr:hypothetical protein [Thiolapillus brandeum]
MTSIPRYVLLFIVFFILRAAVALLIDATTDVVKVADIYEQAARNILAGDGFVGTANNEPIIFRTPAYPYFVAAVYYLFGVGNHLALLMFQAVLDALTGLLIYWTGVKMVNSKAAILAGILFAIYPLSAYYTLRVFPESMFTLGMMAVVASLVWSVETDRPYRFLLVGLMVGLCALVKPVVMLLAPFIGFVMLLRAPASWRRVVRNTALMVVGFVVLVSPWSYRNYLVTGHFIPLATGGGYSMWVGYNLTGDGREDDELDEQTRAQFMEERRAISSYYDTTRNISFEEDRAFMRNAMESVASHPRESFILTLKKLYRFWFDIYAPENKWAQLFAIIMQGGLLLFAIYGAVRLLLLGHPVHLLLAPVVYLMLMHSLVISTLRYSMPTVPVLSLLAVAGLGDLVYRLLSGSNSNWLKSRVPD